LFNQTNKMLKVKTGHASPPENPSLTFPYQTDDFQNHSFNAIDSGDHVLVTAHTGSGKTTVAEYAVAYGLSKKKRVIYTAPIKALSNQIFGDFQTKYPSWNVGIKTGDIDYKSETCDVLIMTTEIVRNMLFKDPESLSDVSVVIFDEVHWIKDESRGTVWEESIIMMPSWIQMIMLSATLPDAEDFCNWIASCKGHDVSYTTTTKRVVPLSHYLMNSEGMHLIMDNEYNFQRDLFRAVAKRMDFRPPMLNSYIRKLELPALFFCFSKRNCERYAKAITLSLVDSWTATTISNEFHRMLRKFDDSYIGMPQTHEVLNLLCKGVGYHHAGLLPPLKEIVQELFSRGLIQVLFVTETFAAGVNMPAKTVVFTGLTKTNGDGTYRKLLPEEYGQMSGRAGRRGKDIKGTVIILPFNPDRDVLCVDEIQKMMGGAVSSIKSRFRIDYSYILKTVHSTGGHDLTKHLDKSLLTAQDNVEVSLLIRHRDKVQQEHDTYPVPSEAAQRARRFDLAFKNHTLGKKDLKTYQTEIRKWITEHPNEFNNVCAVNVLKDKLRVLNGQISAYKDGYLDNLTKLAKFLTDIGYLTPGWGDDVLSLTVKDLTVKGIMAMEVNECNPLMLTELVHGPYLDDLSFPDIVSVLALFLDVSGEDRHVKWPDKAGAAATKYLKAMDELEVQESRAHLCANSDWNTNDRMCDLANLWVQENAVGLPPMLDSLSITDMHPGEFVRMMLKLDNICKEVSSLANICGKDSLLKAMDGHYRFIVRNIVTPQSLYVSMN
jgi:superfamily II RNA helicase